MPLLRYTQRMARLDALAARFEPRIRRALIQGAEPCAEAVQHGASPEVAAALFRNGYLVAVLGDLYERCGVAEARLEYDYLTNKYPRKAQAPPDVVTGWAARLRRFVTTDAAAGIRAITETVRKKVRTVLGRALDEGLSVPDTARALRKEVAEFSGKEAVTVARTELIAASNYGSYLGAEATGLDLVKVWLATPGSRTRPTHAAANGQAVGLRAFFTVGGEQARYPGDPWLSAGERIRCRCSITYRLPETE